MTLQEIRDLSLIDASKGTFTKLMTPSARDGDVWVVVTLVRGYLPKIVTVVSVRSRKGLKLGYVICAKIPWDLKF